MLKVENLKVSFAGNTVLDQLSMELTDKSKWVIIGQNGSGKTTLFKTLLRLVNADSGKIVYDDNEINSGKTELEVSANLPECYRLLPLDCRDMIKAYGEIKNFDYHEVFSHLEEFSLKTILKEVPWKLSTGQQKLLYTIIALCGKNRVVILDEPFENVDFQRKGMLFEMINRSNSAVMISTHETSMLEMMEGWQMHILLTGKLFGPLDPTLSERYFFNMGERSNSAFEGKINGKSFTISLDDGDIPLTSMEKISTMAGRPDL